MFSHGLWISFKITVDCSHVCIQIWNPTEVAVQLLCHGPLGLELRPGRTGVLAPSKDASLRQGHVASELQSMWAGVQQGWARQPESTSFRSLTGAFPQVKKNCVKCPDVMPSFIAT